VWLEITGAYGAHVDAPAEGTNVFEAIHSGPKGYEDKDGVEHFNDRVTTPFGWLGDIKTHVDVGEDGRPLLVIDRAEAVVLVSKKPLSEWSWDQQVGVTMELNPFGFRMFTLNARNGMVRYLLHDDEVRWRDLPDEDTGMQIAKLMHSQWTPEGPLLPRLTHRTDSRVVRRAQ
jgi:hypothetical protein